MENSLEEIEKLRENIDEIDFQIIDLLNKRISICKEIGKVKFSKKIKVIDLKREKEVLDKAGNYRKIFENIIELCRKEQTDNMEKV
ncbi:MAG: chorismate mutase [Caldisphaera sp.]|jgi:chorismate mutase|nr:chorismate mutase [Caldisphaera sp.]PMP92050.1 MAG: chorismate mutase [Caldisphaera sp.]